MYGKCARHALLYIRMNRTAAAIGVWCCSTLLWGAGCNGTEHPLFVDLPRVVEPPPPPMNMDDPMRGPDAAPPPVDIMDAAVHLPEAGPVLGPELDPDVTFEWTETLPGKGTCRAGLYIGKFSCIPVGSDAGAADRIGPVSGQAVFTLRSGSAEEQVLTISSGTLFDDLFGVLYVPNVKLEGELKCADRHFEATAHGESWGLGMFSVALSGSLDDQQLVIEGDLAVVGLLEPDSEPGHCVGTFEVNAAP